MPRGIIVAYTPSRTGTSIALASDATKIKLPTSLTHHRFPTIPLTGINFSLFQARADQRVMDLSWVGWVMACARNLDLQKKVWNRSTESNSAPARDSTLVPWVGSAAGLGRHAMQIYEPWGFIDSTITIQSTVGMWLPKKWNLNSNELRNAKMIIVSIQFNDCDLLI